jgi:hypothetical protein
MPNAAISRGKTALLGGLPAPATMQVSNYHAAQSGPDTNLRSSAHQKCFLKARGRLCRRRDARLPSVAGGGAAGPPEGIKGY